MKYKENLNSDKEDSFFKKEIKKLVTQSAKNRQEIIFIKRNFENIINTATTNILKPDAMKPIAEYYEQLTELLLEQRRITAETIVLYNKAKVGMAITNANNLNTIIDNEQEIIEKNNKQTENMRAFALKEEVLKEELANQDQELEDIKLQVSFSAEVFKHDRHEAIKNRLTEVRDARIKILAQRNAQNIVAAKGIIEKAPINLKKSEFPAVTMEQKNELLIALFEQGIAKKQGSFYPDNYFLNTIKDMLAGKIINVDQNLYNIFSIMSFNLGKVAIEIAKEVRKNSGSDLKIIKTVGEEIEYFVSINGEYKKIDMSDGWLEPESLAMQYKTAEVYEVADFYRLIDVMIQFFATKINEVSLAKMKADDEYPSKHNGKWEYTEEQLRNIYWKLRLIIR